MKLSLLSAVVSSLFATSVLASEAQSCSSSESCPEDYPCCSNDGVCGTGSYCLGPCDPRYSFNSTSCMPAPICKSGTFSPRTGNMIKQTEFLGNASANDFIYYGEVEDADDYVMIKMPANTVGGVISSAFYIWYGKVSVKFKTSHNAGVVSAAILFSQVEDEIDYEFVGSALETAENNFYFEGIANYNNGGTSNVSDTYENWHTYTFDWTEDQIEWLIDGVVQRTLKKTDTYNSTSGEYEFPQTPSRLQMSIWPGGDPTMNAAGTVEWAGGDINWNASDFQDPGYLYVGIDTVVVDCYDIPSTAQKEGTDEVSYIYDGKGFLAENIIISDRGTWMKDLGRTGFNTGEDDEDSSSSVQSSSSTSYSSSSAYSSSSSYSSHSSSFSSSSIKPSFFSSSLSASSSSSFNSSSSEKTTASSKATTETPSSTESSTPITTSTSKAATSSTSGFVQNINTISSTSSSIKNEAISHPTSTLSLMLAFLSLLL